MSAAMIGGKKTDPPLKMTLTRAISGGAISGGISLLIHWEK